MQNAHFHHLYESYVESLTHLSSGIPTSEQVHLVAASSNFGCQITQAMYTSLADEHEAAMDALCRMYPEFDPHPELLPPTYPYP